MLSIPAPIATKKLVARGVGVLSPAVTPETQTQGAQAQPPIPAPRAEGAATVAWTGSTYFAEGLPWSVLHQIASEFFTAAGLPPSQVGYTSALHLTSSLKFLWSPVVDLFGTLRRWMIATQALLGVLIGVLAVLAHDLALGTGEKDTTFIWVTLIVIGVASATHDIACDGYYMDALSKDAQARHAGTRVAAFRIAMLVGNSGLVYLGGRHSWLLGFGLAGGLMLVLAVAHRVLLPPSASERAGRSDAAPVRSGAERAAHVRASYLSFLRQDRALLVVLFLLTYKLGDALMFNMSKVMLRDLGVSTAERGGDQRLRHGGEHPRGGARRGVDRPHLAGAGDRPDHDPDVRDPAAVPADRGAEPADERGPRDGAGVLHGLDGAVADGDHGHHDRRAAVRRHGRGGAWSPRPASSACRCLAPAGLGTPELRWRRWDWH